MATGFWMKIGSTPNVCALSRSAFEKRASTAGAIIGRFLPMRFEQAFRRVRKSWCWMSIHHQRRNDFGSTISLDGREHVLAKHEIIAGYLARGGGHEGDQIG
jgi:hypothetical protein